MIKHTQKLPLRRALIYIALITCLVSGTASMGMLYYFHVKKLRQQDEAYHVVAIVQRGIHKETLRTVYLSELLGLSIDRPSNLYQLNLKDEKQKLLASPLIKSAEIMKLKPGTLVIEYIPRVPVAFLGDFSNTALDDEGFLIPFKPFFSPKKLPEIYLGTFGDEIRWGKPIEGKRGELAMRLFMFFSALCNDEGLVLKTIDVTRAEALSFGQRQIVLELEDSGDIWILRCSLENYETEIARFSVLRRHFRSLEGSDAKDSYRVIDLRIPQLAFLYNKTNR
ncbi:MAG TPA: hypothetical protein VIH61_01615 [Waddliaceae bacterium]